MTTTTTNPPQGPQDRPAFAPADLAELAARIERIDTALRFLFVVLGELSTTVKPLRRAMDSAAANLKASNQCPP